MACKITNQDAKRVQLQARDLETLNDEKIAQQQREVVMQFIHKSCLLTIDC